MVALSGALVGAILGLTFSWLFYVLVLIFLGGIIVLIIYITALRDNEKYTKSFSKLILGISAFWGLSRGWIRGAARTTQIPGELFSEVNHQVILFLTSYLLVLLFLAVKTVKKDAGALTKFA